MTHLPYIAASYGIFAAISLWMVLAAGLRLRRATTRLRAVDPRAGTPA
jgi:hypothetical protein